METLQKLAVAVIAGATLGAGAMQALHAQPRPPVYVVAEFDVTDAAGFKSYGDANGALFQSMGGRYLARGGAVEAIAGALPKQRVAIYTFESMEKMRAWRDSPKYKELSAIRDRSSNFRSFAVEGLPN
jgi:uncharacterized protein (DUF1330 family)